MYAGGTTESESERVNLIKWTAVQCLGEIKKTKFIKSTKGQEIVKSHRPEGTRQIEKEQACYVQIRFNIKILLIRDLDKKRICKL